ncbi:LacI family transcriptional regulator [Xanthomonas populi]|uniref:LacI family transcriptional regulator n=1 Tax=Xanthomonas populi TaxID=53414 RepID=A0A2S7ESW8_9XANT|nr:LacI family DNA-binding transcriptional regulator [Xanthomonas populi]PPU96200.1 LacI family transcriptional regulator [Xanthomonas populi]
MAKGAFTIKDVAREAQVSVATVSRALNGHENVAGPVRQLVQDVAARLRYSPHAAARSLSSRRTQTLGVVLPDLHGEFFSELIRSIGGAARAAGQHLLVSSYHGDPEAQGRALQSMRGRVDCLLVLSPYAEQPGFLTDNLPQALPTVLINAHLPGADYPVLSIDDHAGAIAMTEHLLCAGHRRIAFIGGPVLNFDARERLRGFRDAIAAHADQAQGLEYPGDFDEASGHRAGLAMLADGALPDAVFAANDMTALGCLYAFAQADVSVPGDVALAGFDDIPLARFVHPALTTMRVSIAHLGEQAMTRLMRLVDQSGQDDGLRQLLTPELVIRASCGAGEPAL